ncbi:hypothetical protein BGZ95_001140 [Linnemannia exigua]|uniref:Uncharacterized protein n=1 Tax=Linnemannia exigua TaxID=604196 RepID=A0AAD4H498_9FUNG|nr:hypothetical protein BGZ95_001140 [Linnemannia exigua]
MRRVHPQRVKPPVQSQNNNNNHISNNPTPSNTSGANYKNKTWTTHSELYKRYAANNSKSSSVDNSLQQAVAQAKQAATNPMTGRKSFAFNPSSMLRPSHDQDHPDATNSDQGGIPHLLTTTNRSGNEGTGRNLNASAISESKCLVVVDGSGDDHGDDDDIDDFDLPDVADLFPSKFRRVDGSGNTEKTTTAVAAMAVATNSHAIGRQQTSLSLDKGSLSLTNHSDSNKDKKTQAEMVQEEEEDPWVMSIHPEDQDLDLFPQSPTSTVGGFPVHTDNQQRHQVAASAAVQQHQQYHQNSPPIMSTRSEMSKTQHTLNEINSLVMDEFPTQSPSRTCLQTIPFEDCELSEFRSMTPDIEAPEQPSSRDMDVSGVGNIAGPFGEHQQDEQMDTGVTLRADGTDDSLVDLTGSRASRLSGGIAHAETLGELPVGHHENPDAAVPGEKAASVASQASDGDALQRQTLTFTLPDTSADFHARLKQLSSSFQSSLDDMMDAIKEVEQFRSTVEKSLTDRQDVLHQRGERIHQQARRLQDEATILHSKGRQYMLHAARSDLACVKGE